MATKPVVVRQGGGVALGRQGDALVVEKLRGDAPYGGGVDRISETKAPSHRFLFCAPWSTSNVTLSQRLCLVLFFSGTHDMPCTALQTAAVPDCQLNGCQHYRFRSCFHTNCAGLPSAESLTFFRFPFPCTATRTSQHKARELTCRNN